MNADGAARGAKILIFDSGLGGLTVLAGIARRRPDVELIYAADDAFFPMARSARRRSLRASAR